MTILDTGEHVYRDLIDKSKFVDGPWMDEPDRIEWIDDATEYPCLMIRGVLGHWCGYVGVNSSHPSFLNDQRQLDIDVHGGLTFSGKRGLKSGLSDQELWAQSRIKQLLSLRKAYPEFFEGSLKHFAPKEGVYTYFRLPETPSDSMLMVILNKKETILSLDNYSAMLSGFDQIKRLSDGKTWSVDDTLSLPAMSANVFIVQ